MNTISSPINQAPLQPTDTKRAPDGKPLPEAASQVSNLASTAALDDSPRLAQLSKSTKPSATAPITKDIDAAVAKLNEYMQSIQRDLSFSVDDQSGRLVVLVVDHVSEEVIRQIPPELILRLAQNLYEQESPGLFRAEA